MTVDSFVEFMDDSAVLQTHAQLDDNDAPIEFFSRALDPIGLIRSLPKNTTLNNNNNNTLKSYEEFNRFQYNNNNNNNNNSTNQSNVSTSTIDFGQFYQLLLLITEIVYSDLYKEDATVAFSKILQVTFVDVVCVTYVYVLRCVCLSCVYMYDV